MDIPESFRNLMGRGTSQPETEAEEQAKRLDGGQIVAEGAEQIAIEVPEDSDVDAEQIEKALAGNASSVQVKGQTAGETTVTPVASGTDINITDSAFDLSKWEYKAHLDDQITNLMDNRVSYNQETGQWILSNDDLVPGILIRLKSLMLGMDGLQVDPEDPDSEADQRMADHLEKVYEGEPNVEPHVDPGKVIDRILEQNIMNAVFVGRSTDLQHLDVDNLSYVKDGETGEEIYIQDPTSYTTFEIEEDGEPNVEFERKEDSTALEIGEEVVDVRLYRTPPLQAVSDDVVNKLQLKRLQGRKAEIASIGGVIIKVNPPAWLAEEDYDQYVDSSDDQFGDENGRLLELVMAQQIDAALSTLEDYQTATVMSIPENWETDTIELPEMDETMSSMIRDYNEAISRRLLLPLDLIELKEGPELSRNSMMQMFLDQISGWQGQITDMFDQFATIQAEIHDMGGSVEHSLPSIAAEDEEEIIRLFNFAGLLGLSEAEGRELANILEGVDLDTDQVQDMPQEGGPEDTEDREQQMQEFLEEQGAESGDEGDEPQGSPTEEQVQQAQASLADEDQTTQATQDGEPICWVCGESATHLNETPPYEYTCSYHGISPNHVPIGTADIRAASQLPDPPSAPTERLRDLWKELLNRSFGNMDDRLSIEASWNPAAHPRGPDGQFVERPFDVPDSVLGMDTEDILQELADEDPDFGEKVEDLGIDGVLDVDESLDEALEDSQDMDVGVDDIPDSATIDSEEELLKVWKNGWDQTTEDRGVLEDTDISFDEFAERVSDVEQEMGGVVDTAGAASVVLSNLKSDTVRMGSTDVPESKLGPELTETGLSVLERGDMVLVDDTAAKVLKSNSKFIDVNRGDGREQLPTISHNIRLIETEDTTAEDLQERVVSSNPIQAQGSFSEGEEVETPSGMGVVVEVRTEDFDGPDGDVEASDDNPAYIVGVEDGVRVYRESDLSDGEIETEVESPESDLADNAEAMEATVGWIEAVRGDRRFSYPESWRKSPQPSRLILLKAWAGMNGQFDCGGDCCKGEMMSSGMSDRASDRFCASMKDRVMGGWEGWRRGGGSKAPVQASHAFSGFETAREAAAHIRDIAERRTPEGHTTEMRKRDDDGFAVVVRDREGNFQASMVVREAETEDDQWIVIGGQQFGW